MTADPLGAAAGRPVAPSSRTSRNTMLMYEYSCPACGPFTAFRPLAAFREPCACPACGAASTRDFLSAPALASMDRARRGPASNGREESSYPAAKAAHPAGCGCCMRRSPIPVALSSKGRVFTSSGPPRRGS
ncbi:zinc ribbon domain-containing protein [Agrobacterium sp. Ap1]|uniref:FmdB family zinc ribbon protein n=1 Tax=Agrobacterium sp. Ap1 TaxID=2815337 RepID=UPI00336BCE40